MHTTFTRIQTDDIDALIQDEELVLALISQLGFDSNALQQLAQNPENTNPETLFHTLESRWNGHGQVFSLEDQAPLLETIAQHTPQLKHTPIAKLSNAGKAIPILHQGEHIRLLFPAEIETIHELLTQHPIETLQATAETLLQTNQLPLEQQSLISAPLWQLHEGLSTFFQNAQEEDQFILLTREH